MNMFLPNKNIHPPRRNTKKFNQLKNSHFLRISRVYVCISSIFHNKQQRDFSQVIFLTIAQTLFITLWGGLNKCIMRLNLPVTQPYLCYRKYSTVESAFVKKNIGNSNKFASCFQIFKK